MNQRESERMQAVKMNSQANSLVKYLEQRETSLLHSLQEARHACGSGIKFIDCLVILYNFWVEEKTKELSNIIEEQRIIIQSLKEEYTSLVKDYESCLRNVRHADLQAQVSSLAISIREKPSGVR